MKIKNKPRSLLCTCPHSLGFGSWSILPDSIRGKLSEALVPVVEMSNSFQWSWQFTPKEIPNALSVDFIGTQSFVLEWRSRLPSKDHRVGPTRLLEPISWIDRCRQDPRIIEYFVNSRIRLLLMGTNKILLKNRDGCFRIMIRGLKGQWVVSRPLSQWAVLYHFDWFGLGCDLWPDGRNFGYVQCWCDGGHGLKFGRPRETVGGSSKVWSGNVGEKSLIVVKNEWLGQFRDLITHWWQLIIEERREDWILLQFPSIILLYLSI